MKNCLNPAIKNSDSLYGAVCRGVEEYEGPDHNIIAFQCYQEVLKFLETRFSAAILNSDDAELRKNFMMLWDEIRSDHE